MDKDFLFARSSSQPPSTKENSTALESKRQLLNVGSYCIWQKKLMQRCTQLCLFVLLVFCAFRALCVPGKFNNQSLLSQHAVFLPIPKSFGFCSCFFFFIFPIPSLSLILFCCFRGELFGYIATASFEIGRPKYDTQTSLSSLPPFSRVVHLVTEVADFNYKAELTLAMMSFNWEITSKFLQ